VTARKAVAALAALVTLTAAAPATAALPAGHVPAATVELPDPAERAASAVVGSMWLVGARTGARVAALARAHGARRIGGRAYLVPRGRARDFADALRARGALAYAEPNRRRATRQEPVPPTAPPPPVGDPLSVVPQAGWRDAVVAGAPAPPVGPTSPLIALVDSQLDVSHPEIVGSNMASTGGRLLADFHGTATATLAAAPLNGVGFLGLWPGARALNLPLPSEISCADSARQIAEAVRLGAAVINMSYGSSAACRTEYEAIQRAIARGVVPVAAAGNEFSQGNPAEFPASLPHVLTVAATGADNRATFFSNQNSAIDLSAPGEDVLAGVPAAFDPDGNPDGFATVSGTSFSAPMVSAAVAWVRAARPDLTPDQVAQVVRLGAVDVGKDGWDASTGFGVLNLPGALAKAPPAADPNEPNDDLEFVDGRVLGRRAPSIFSSAPATLTGLLDRYEDPIDVYRIRVPPRATVQVRARPAYGDPDLYVYTPAAATVTGSRGLVGRSLRRGRRVDGLQLRNLTGRRQTRFVVLGIDDRVSSLDAGYTLRIRRL
jgi:hypothetical protein